MTVADLNTLCIPHDDGESPPLFDWSCDAIGTGVSVYFRKLDKRLTHLIGSHHDAYGDDAVVVGCVAWLTNATILRALARVNCQILVQKEDLWRPDTGTAGSKSRIRALYDSLKCDIPRPEAGDLVGSLSVCCDPSIDPVRCVGHMNSDRRKATPRSHHKFVVFCRRGEESRGPHWYRDNLVPLSVWTGSFNFTENGCASLENAVHIINRTVAEAYLNEWQQVFALSEPLDWTSEWCEPEYRIGT